VLLGIWGLIVAVTGGVDTRVFGVVIRSRDPFRAVVASLALFVLASVRHREETAQLLDRAGATLRRHAIGIVLAGAAALAAHGVVFGVFGVGGSDSYGYVNQAYDWASGALPRPIPLPLSLPFETADPMQTPLGYSVGTRPHTMAPIYAPGLPLLMALALVAGACGPYFVVPLCAALFVWFTYLLGREACGPVAGITAGVVLIASPVVLFQTLWPMSDIPSGALWTGALVFALRPSRRHAAAAGLCAAIGLLVRPNLALLCAVPLLTTTMTARGRDRWTRAALFCAPIVPVVLSVAATRTMWFGSAGTSGFGSAGELYHLSNVWPNLKLNGSWLWESQSPWVLLAILPLVPPFARHVTRAPLGACLALAAATLASYVSYTQFDAWWYLRFLMPAFGALAVLMAAGIVSIARTMPSPYGAVAAGAALYATVLSTLPFAAHQLVFGGLRAGERRYIVAGEFVADHLPANAAVLAMQHSGNIRFYSGRLTLRYDWVQPEWASGVPATIERAGYHPYLLVDDWEIPQVRRQFGLPEDGRLPWPILAHTSELSGITVFDLATNAGSPSPIAFPTKAHHWCEARRRAPI
jgi:hypothetical protein